MRHRSVRKLEQHSPAGNLSSEVRVRESESQTVCVGGVTKTLEKKLKLLWETIHAEKVGKDL
jgi:hypothetical protein